MFSPQTTQFTQHIPLQTNEKPGQTLGELAVFDENEIPSPVSRDNSVILVRALIKTSVCDLDVELQLGFNVEGKTLKSVRLINCTWFEFRSTQVRLVSIKYSIMSL